MKRRWVALGLAGLLIAGVVLAQSVMDDPIDTASNGPGAGGTTISGGDTLNTGIVNCWGADQVVFVIKATTGADSALVLMVSQNGTKFFTPTQDGTHCVLVDGVSGDSLSNGPHTAVAVALNNAKSIPIMFPYKYCRLKVYGKTGTMITGLAVQTTPIFRSGMSGDFKDVYNYPW